MPAETLTPAVARAVVATAGLMQAQLASLPVIGVAKPASAHLYEADLQNALASSLQAQLGAIVRREQSVRGIVEMWSRDCGPIDMPILTPAGEPCALLEAKWCTEDSSWNLCGTLLRPAALVATDEIKMCFLVTGAPEAGMEEKPYRPTELYEDCTLTTAELLARHAKGWAYCLSGAGARVKVLPATSDIRHFGAGTAVRRARPMAFEMRGDRLARR